MRRRRTGLGSSAEDVRTSTRKELGGSIYLCGFRYGFAEYLDLDVADASMEGNRHFGGGERFMVPRLTGQLRLASFMQCKYKYGVASPGRWRGKANV